MKDVVSASWETFLLRRLKDRTEAEAYLQAAFEEHEDVFELAIRQVAEAQGRLKEAVETDLRNLSSVTALLRKLGFDFAVRRSAVSKRTRRKHREDVEERVLKHPKMQESIRRARRNYAAGKSIPLAEVKRRLLG